MKRREAEAGAEEMLAAMLADAPNRLQSQNHYVVVYVATTGAGNYFSGAVDVGIETPYDSEKLTLSFSGAVALACQKLAGVIAPKNVGQIFSPTGTLRVHHVSTGKEEIFAGDAV
jgi:hypothetical protein